MLQCWYRRPCLQESQPPLKPSAYQHVIGPWITKMHTACSWRLDLKSIGVNQVSTYLAPPPPSTTPIDVPVRKRAKREKSDILSAFVSICFLYNSIYNSKFTNYQKVFNKCNHITTVRVKIELLVVNRLTILASALLVKTRLGHLMWWWDDSHPLAFSHSTVPLGVSASSRWSNINSFCALTDMVSICFSIYRFNYIVHVLSIWTS